MLPAGDVQTDSACRTTTFRSNAGVTGYVATIFTLAAIGALVMTIRGVDQPPQNPPSTSDAVWGFRTLALGVMATWFWRLYAIRKRPLLRIGREGIEVNLGVAIIQDFPMRMLTLSGLMRPRFGWIPWYQLQSVEARPSVTEYHAKAGGLGGLVLVGGILIMRAEGPNPSGVGLGESLAILTSAFQSTPALVAAQIQPYLDHPDLRQSLPSLFES